MKQATLPFLKDLTEEISSDGMCGLKKNDLNSIVVEAAEIVPIDNQKEIVYEIIEDKVIDKHVDSTLTIFTNNEPIGDVPICDIIEDEDLSEIGFLPKKTILKKSENAYHTIGETSDLLGVPTHVLRFWEEKFSILNPVKRNGGRRYYRPLDLRRLKQIKDLLYTQGYTIKGVQQLFKSKKTDTFVVETENLVEMRSNTAILKDELKILLNDVVELRNFLKK
jgi:DNA-binding transcriptional MerR regulator